LGDFKNMFKLKQCKNFLQELKIAKTTIQYKLLYLLTGEITHVDGMITLYFESREYIY